MEFLNTNIPAAGSNHRAVNPYANPETIYQVLRYLTQETLTLAEIQPELDQYLRYVMRCPISGDRTFENPPFQPPNDDEVKALLQNTTTTIPNHPKSSVEESNTSPDARENQQQPESQSPDRTNSINEDNGSNPIPTRIRFRIPSSLLSSDVARPSNASEAIFQALIGLASNPDCPMKLLWMFLRPAPPLKDGQKPFSYQHHIKCADKLIDLRRGELEYYKNDPEASLRNPLLIDLEGLPVILKYGRDGNIISTLLYEKSSLHRDCFGRAHPRKRFHLITSTINRCICNDYLDLLIAYIDLFDSLVDLTVVREDIKLALQKKNVFSTVEAPTQTIPAKRVGFRKGGITTPVVSNAPSSWVGDVLPEEQPSSSSSSSSSSTTTTSASPFTFPNLPNNTNAVQTTSHVDSSSTSQPNSFSTPTKPIQLSPKPSPFLFSSPTTPATTTTPATNPFDAAESPDTQPPTSTNPFGTTGLNSKNPFGVSTSSTNPFGATATNPFGTTGSINPFGTIPSSPNPFGTTESTNSVGG
jgi:hypothetical protein